MPIMGRSCSREYAVKAAQLVRDIASRTNPFAGKHYLVLGLDNHSLDLTFKPDMRHGPIIIRIERINEPQPEACRASRDLTTSRRQFRFRRSRTTEVCVHNQGSEVRPFARCWKEKRRTVWQLEETIHEPHVIMFVVVLPAASTVIMPNHNVYCIAPSSLYLQASTCS